MVRPLIRNTIGCLTLALFLSLIVFVVRGQNSGFLSTRPPVIRIFDPDKDETTISADLVGKTDPGMLLGLDPNRPPPEILLYSVDYTYPGKVRSRPQTVAFVVLPSDKFKTPPHFSLLGDGTMVHEGEATLTELCCAKVNGRTENSQHVLLAVPVDIFERITQAMKVELKLTSKSRKYSFKLSDYQKKCLTALQNTMK